MKVISLLFRQTCQLFLSVFFIVLLFCIAGCGEEDIEPPSYNPISPLPLRINVTVTPTPDSTFSRTQNLENQEEISDEKIGQNTPTPFPDIQSMKTSTPKAQENSESPDPPIQITPTPTLTPTTTSTSSPSPKKSKVLPTPTPIAETPEPTKTLKATETVPEDSHKGEKNNNPSSLQKADVKQADKQTAQKTEKFVPTVTPYNVTIDKLAICSKISNRNPVNCGDEFSLSETNKVYSWMRVSGIKPPKVIKHVYYWKGTLVATVKLKLKYASMRTWSQKTFKPEQALGKWKVVITTEKDEVITIKEFTVVQ